MTACIVNNNCNNCTDVAIVYRMVNEERDCDNIVELRIPNGGSKEKYMAQRFSPDFVYANRFQCATVPVYNTLNNNSIDNRRQFEFTESDQNALTKRGINNYLTAQKLLAEGKLIHDKQSFTIPMNVAGRSSYAQFGDTLRTGSTITGLANDDLLKTYFR
jgi:hypothetical protein